MASFPPGDVLFTKKKNNSVKTKTTKVIKVKSFENKDLTLKQSMLIVFKNCHYCNIKLDEYNRTVDHLVPKSKNGSNHIENMVMCCDNCNSLKSNMDYADFVMMLAKKILKRDLQ